MLNKEFVEIKKIVNEVQSYVEEEKHAYILPEHLLLILLNDVKVNKFFGNINFNNKELLKEDLLKFLSDLEKVDDISKIVPTSAYTNIMQRAIMLAGLRVSEPDSLQVLQAIFHDEDGHGKYFLMKHGITEDKLTDYLKNRKEVITTNLEKYGVNLVEMARLGKIGKIVGREKEIERMTQILNKKKSNNVCICSLPGVGKSSLVEGFAKNICEGLVPTNLQGYDVWALDLGSMISGTKFRGEFEERLQNVIKEIVAHPKCFVFIDEIHTIIGAGNSGNEGTLDASNILKPYLSRGEIRLIGATTYEEYKNRILKDKAFARRFKKIDLNEPSKEETLEILKGIQSEYETYHNVKFTEDNLRDIIEYSGRYISDKYFPDKAIDIMDEIGAGYRSGLKKGEIVSKEDVEEVICRICNLKEISTSVNEKTRLKDLDIKIKEELYGQDSIVDSIVKKIKMSKCGLSNKGKCLSIFCLGSSGVGKTELVKQLSKHLDMNFVKLDMSEYSLEMDVNKLTGCAQGFVGYEQTGALTEPVIRQPNSIILLDEIEKAHKNVYNLLLQVMDEGKLTDNNGRIADYKNAILIMTSNIGISQSEESSDNVGFVRTEEMRKEHKKEVIENVMKKHFPPEFRNRIQETFIFNELDKHSLKLIIDKNLRRINLELLESNVFIELSEKVKDYFVEEAFKEKMGGRPIERLIDKHISEKIVDEILYGKVSKGGKIFVDYNKEFIYNYA